MSDVAEKREQGLRAAPLISWGLLLVVASVGLGVWVYVRGNGPFVIDEWWNDVVSGESVPILSGLSLALNFLGGGWFAVFVVPIGGAIALILLKRPWSATYYIAAQAISAGLVQLMKLTFGRARPEEILVMSDVGSFPSGHVAGAATLATAVAVLFPRVAVYIVGAVWIVLMAFSRTYLHAHWLTDTAGGALVGIGTALVLAGALARPLTRELPARGEWIPRR